MGKVFPDIFRGSIPPRVTPFVNGSVDYDQFRTVILRQIEAGSHGIPVNGTTAEPSCLSVEERNCLVSIAVETATGRAVLVAATGSQSLMDWAYEGDATSQLALALRYEPVAPPKATRVDPW